AGNGRGRGCSDRRGPGSDRTILTALIIAPCSGQQRGDPQREGRAVVLDRLTEKTTVLLHCDRAEYKGDECRRTGYTQVIGAECMRSDLSLVERVAEQHDLRAIPVTEHDLPERQRRH